MAGNSSRGSGEPRTSGQLGDRGSANSGASSVTRRRFLASAGAVGALGVLAGCPALSPDGEPSTETPTDGVTTRTTTQGTPAVDLPSAYAERFGDVVDLEAAGADASGGHPINDVLDRAFGDDTLLYLPPGEYTLDGRWVLPGFENVGIYGPDATILPTEGYSGDMFVFGGDEQARGLLVDGLTFDVDAPDTGPRVLEVNVADELLVRDLSVTGVQDTDHGLTRFDVTDPDGSARVERMSMPDGGSPGTLATGCLVGPLSEGSITFADCHIAGFPDNGLYGSPAPGAVDVHGGTYANNGIANVRVSGESTVRGVRVVCDEAREGIQNMRGIRLRGGDGTVVENCIVDVQAVTTSDGAITLSSAMGSATIRDTTIRVDANSIPAIRAKQPSGADDVDDSGPTCERVSIVGSASRDRAVYVIDRPSSSFEGCCIEQTGDDRDGLSFLRSDEAVVRDSRINVTGEAVVSQNSTVRTSGLETTADVACRPDRL